MIFRHAGIDSCKTLYHRVLHDKNLKARLLTLGVGFFPPGLPGTVFQWHDRGIHPITAAGPSRIFTVFRLPKI